MSKNDFYHTLGLDTCSEIKEYIGKNLADRPRGLLSVAVSSSISSIYIEFS